MGWDIVSALLAKTLQSSTLKRALAFIAIFGAVVVVLFAYVHGSTVSYLRSRSDEMIMSEVAILKGALAAGGRDALIGVMTKREADEHFKDSVYLLADASFSPLAGSLGVWPSSLKGRNGLVDFSSEAQTRDAARRRPFRAFVDILEDGTHLLVGKDIDVVVTSMLQNSAGRMIFGRMPSPPGPAAR